MLLIIVIFFLLARLFVSICVPCSENSIATRFEM